MRLFITVKDAHSAQEAYVYIDSVAGVVNTYNHGGPIGHNGSQYYTAIMLNGGGVVHCLEAPNHIMLMIKEVYATAALKEAMA